VEVGQSFYVTGGWLRSAPDSALKTVAEYSQTGFVRYMPDLIQRRFHHACSSFINGNGETVGIDISVSYDNHWPSFNRSYWSPVGSFTAADKG